MTHDTQPTDFAVIVAPRDIAAGAAAPTVPEQSRLAFDDVAAQLAERGLDFSDIVKTRLLYSSRSDFPEMNTVRDPLYRASFADDNFPAASGVVTGGRGGAGPRFELEVIAVKGSKRQNSDSVVSRWGTVVPPFSHSHVSPELLVVSGQGPHADGGDTPDPSIGGQAHRALEAVGEVLAASGRSAADLLSLNLYLTPAGQREFAAVATEVTRFVGETAHPPVVTIIGVADLAFDGMDVEAEGMTGDPDAPAAHSSRVASTSARGAIPSTAAVRQGSMVSAASRAAGETGGEDVVDLLTEARDTLEESLVEVGATLIDPGFLVTVWFSPPAARARLEGALGSLGAGTVSLQPIVEPSANPAIVLEVFGRSTS